MIFFIAILVITVIFARRGTEDEGEWSLSPKVKAIPERLRGLWYIRNLSRFGFGALFGGLVLLGLFLTKNSNLYTWTPHLGLCPRRPVGVDAHRLGWAALVGGSSPSPA